MEQPNVRRGSALLIASRVVVFIASAGSALVLARILGPDGYGVVAAATAVSAILLLLGAFGIDQLYLVGRMPEDALRVRCTQAAIASTGIVAVGALAWPGVDWRARACILLIGAAAAADQLKLPFLLVPQRQLRFGRRAVRETAFRIAVAVATIAAAAVRATPLAVAAATLIVSLALVPLARCMPRFERGLGFRSALAVGRLGAPYAASGALYTLYFQVDMALLASLRAADEVAQYRAAYSFVAAAVVLAVVLNNEIMRPRLYAAAGDAPRVASIRRTSAAVSVLAGAACTIGMVTLGPALLRVAYGADYRPAEPLVRILGLAMTAHFFNSWAGNALVAKGLVRRVVMLQAGLVATNVLGNLALIPGHGARGAAVMTVVTEWTGVLAYGLLLGTARSGRRDDDEALADERT